MDGRFLIWLRQLLGLIFLSWLAKVVVDLTRGPAVPVGNASPKSEPGSRLTAGAKQPQRHEGQYDIRRGTAGYAPIVGLFGSLAVPAIVVVFTVSPQPGSSGSEKTLIAFATGLLVIGMFGSLLAAIGLAAIGAEQDPTANLAAATMFIAVPAALSIVSVLGAFEVLAVLYVSQASTLFTMITAAGGAFGVVFNAYSASDSPGLGPTDPDEHARWLKTQWLKDKATAYRWGGRIALVSLVPIATGVAGTLWPRWQIPLTNDTVNWVIGSGIVLSILGTFLSVRRTAHPIGGQQKGLRPAEAFGSNLIVSSYVAALILCLP